MSFQQHLAQSLSKSTNKRELINILKRKLAMAAHEQDQNPTDHLKLLDKFLKSGVVKRFTQQQKKHYLSSKIVDAIEVKQGYSLKEEVSDKKSQSVVYKKFESPVPIKPMQMNHSFYENMSEVKR